MNTVVRELPPGKLASARSYRVPETDFGSGYIDITFRLHVIDQEWSSRRCGLRLLLSNSLEDWGDVTAELGGIFTHREMAERFHDDDFGTGDTCRRAQRIIGRAGEIVLAG